MRIASDPAITQTINAKLAMKAGIDVAWSADGGFWRVGKHKGVVP
jgi:hypothetical protein